MIVNDSQGNCFWVKAVENGGGGTSPAVVEYARPSGPAALITGFSVESCHGAVNRARMPGAFPLKSTASSTFFDKRRFHLYSACRALSRLNPLRQVLFLTKGDSICTQVLFLTKGDSICTLAARQVRGMSGAQASSPVREDRRPRLSLQASGFWQGNVPGRMPQSHE